jgi:hypothetical protein
MVTTTADDKIQPLTQPEWAQLLTQYHKFDVQLKKVSTNNRIPKEEQRKEEKRLAAILTKLDKEYIARLPRLPLSRCPYCKELLMWMFDPFGLEGFWWQSQLPFKEENYPKACKHFVLLLGALNLNGLPPKGGKEVAYPGPEVPYVIARLLNAHSTRVAVISSVSMYNGYTAYPIAYFSEEEPRIYSALTASWGRETYNLPSGWTDTKNEVLDYDLQPWIEQGKVKWIEPRDDNHTIGELKGFPYGNLEGKRKPLVIRGDRALP